MSFGGQRPRPQGLEGDVELLRPAGGDWEPQAILKRFGAAVSPQDQLPRLLTAVAIIYGAQRISMTAAKLERNCITLVQPIRTMVQNETLKHRHDLLKQVFQRLHEARGELHTVMTRGDNDARNMHGGLRGTDLAYMVMGIRTVILASELVTRRSPVGIEQAIGLVLTPPGLTYAEEWQERLFDTQVLEGVQLFYPESFGRVILVYDDGRLAYDPAPEPEEEEDIY